MIKLKNHLPIALGGGFLFFLIDQICKYFAHTNPHFSQYFIEPWLSFELFKNPGIAFGLPLQNSIVLIITPFIILYLILFLTKPSTKTSQQQTWGSILVIAGALSNYFDRILFGYTIDYIRILNSVINLGDISILIGVIYLILQKQKPAVDKYSIDPPKKR